MKRIIIYINRIFANPKIFYFTVGLLFASSIYFYTEHQYEKEIFIALKKYTQSQINKKDQNNIDSILVHSTYTTHVLEESRQQLFKELKGKSFKSKYLQPITYDLMTGQGACGSNSYVLGRLLKEFDIDIKFAQMYVSGKPGGHIVIEAKNNRDWVVLDALYNQVFIDSLGRLATFKEVGSNWNYFKRKVGSDYDLKYSYEGVQYTNWNKVPIILPFIKKILVFFKGEDYVQALSLRNVLLQKFKIIYTTLFVITLLLVLKRSYSFYKIKKDKT